MTLTYLMMYQQPVGRENGFRETPEEFADAFQVWASLEPLSATERDRGAAVSVTATHRIRCHYHADIAANGCFAYEGRIFHIAEVINVKERNKELTIRVNEHGT